MAARYIFGNNQLPTIVSKLSGSTKNLTSGLMQDPQKIENVISMVRTIAPLTPPQTVSKVNVYLPLFEKVSTLLGMYSFLNRAQTFKPIEPLNAKSPVDMMSALMKNGNLPIGKLAQPLLANNMEKMMGSMAMNMLKNGGMNDLLKGGGMGDLLKGGGMNDLLKNANISDMLSSLTQPNNSSSSNNSSNNIDLASLMDTFMPLINSMNSSSNSEEDEQDDYNSYNDYHDSNSYNNHNINNDNSYGYDHNYNYNPNKKIELINESVLPEEETDDQNNSEITYANLYDQYDKSKYDNLQRPSPNDRNDKIDRNNRVDKFDKFDGTEKINKNETYEKKEAQKPIRIKQRRRR